MFYRTKPVLIVLVAAVITLFVFTAHTSARFSATKAGTAETTISDNPADFQQPTPTPKPIDEVALEPKDELELEPEPIVVTETESEQDEGTLE